MKLTIVGAGAIGGVTGAYLIQAGHDVTFVDLEEEHVRVINERGLTIEGIRGTFTVPARAIHPRDLQGPLQRVIIAVKALHTEAAARQMQPYLADEATSSRSRTASTRRRSPPSSARNARSARTSTGPPTTWSPAGSSTAGPARSTSASLTGGSRRASRSSRGSSPTSPRPA